MSVTSAVTSPLTSALARAITAGGGGFPSASYVKTGMFGDSTADAKSLATASFLDQTVADAETTGGTLVRALNINKFLMTRYYPAAQLEYNAGISGQTTTQMLARSGAGAGPTRRSIEDLVAAIGGGLIIARCGSVNDISGFTTATPQATIDAVFTRHMQIISGLAAGGAYVLDEGIAGFDAIGGVPPSAPNLAFIRAVVIELNTRFAAAIEALGNRKIRFLSPVGVTCDATGAFLTNVTNASDGTHLTDYGQTLVAQAEAAIMPGWIGPSAATPFTGTNLVATQAAYPNSTVVAFGTVPDATYFTWGVSNGTRQNATIESINGVNFATCELLPTGASTSLQFFCNLVPLIFSPAQVAAGDIVTIEVDIYADALTGALAPQPLVPRIQLGVTASDRIVYDMATTLAAATGTQTAIAGRVSYGKVKIPVAFATLTTGNTYLRITMQGTNGFVSRLKVGNLRIVKQ